MNQLKKNNLHLLAKIINAGWVEEVEGAERFMPIFPSSTFLCLPQSLEHFPMKYSLPFMFWEAQFFDYNMKVC